MGHSMMQRRAREELREISGSPLRGRLCARLHEGDIMQVSRFGCR